LNRTRPDGHVFAWLAKTTHLPAKQMTRQFIVIFAQVGFWFTLLISVGSALRWGGKTERVGATAMLSAAALTSLLVSSASERFTSVETGVLIVDVTLLGALLWLTVTSPRFWPIWSAAFQLVAILTHLAAGLLPKSVAAGYSVLQGFWAYPAMFAMLLGVYGVVKAKGSASLNP
jgi:CBS domain containing-hemolysin-like protein